MRDDRRRGRAARSGVRGPADRASAHASDASSRRVVLDLDDATTGAHVHRCSPAMPITVRHDDRSTCSSIGTTRVGVDCQWRIHLETERRRRARAHDGRRPRPAVRDRPAGERVGVPARARTRRLTASSWSDRDAFCDHRPMAIGITEEHEELRQAVRRFVDDRTSRPRRCAPWSTRRPRPGPRSGPRSREPGWLGLHVAEAHGGAGYGLVEQAVVLEELGRGVRAGSVRRRPRSPPRSSQDAGGPAAEELAAAARGGRAAPARSRSSGAAPGARRARRRRDRVRGRRRRGTRSTRPTRDGDRAARASTSTRRVARARPRRCARAGRPPARRTHRRARARPRRGAARGRSGRRRAVVRRHRGRVREGARAVRPADRPVPGREAPLRRHAGAHRARARRGVGRGPRRATTPTTAAALAIAAAAALAFDAAFLNGKDCVQTLGGIGFTWEHDAHLYLRRAMTLHQLVGHARRVARARGARACRAAPAGALARRPRPGSRGASAPRCARSSTRSRTSPPREQRDRLADDGLPHAGLAARRGAATPRRSSCS